MPQSADGFGVAIRNHALLQNLTVGNPHTQYALLAGAAFTGPISSTGAITATGLLTANSGISAVGNIAATGILSGASLSVTGAVGGATAAISGLATVGSLSSGAITAAAISGASLTLTGDIVLGNTSRIIGGSSTNADLVLQTTSGVGATGADMLFKVGNNGGTLAIAILNNGKVGIGESNPRAALSIGDDNGYQGGLFVKSASGQIVNFGGVLELTTGVGASTVGQGIRVDGANRKFQFLVSSSITADSEAFEIDTPSSVSLFSGPTIGTKSFVRIADQAEFKPTSGSATLSWLKVNGLVNQTGTANGTTSGIWINTDITAAADFRALRITPNVGHAIYQEGASATNLFNGPIQHGEGSNIVVGTATGTKIGTAATQKLGFFNATPIVRPVLATGAGATVDNVITVLQNLGLVGQT